MMKGRKADSVAAQVAKGKLPPSAKAGDDLSAMAEDEASTANQASDSPRWITGNFEQSIWNDITRRSAALNYIKDTDEFVLARYVTYSADWIKATMKLQHEGDTYKVKSAHGTYIRPHPLVKQRRDLEKDLRDMEDRLGLNPLARQRILQQLAAGALGGMGGRPLGHKPEGDNDDVDGQPGGDDAMSYFDVATVQ